MKKKSDKPKIVRKENKPNAKERSDGYSDSPKKWSNAYFEPLGDKGRGGSSIKELIEERKKSIEQPRKKNKEKVTSSSSSFTESPTTTSPLHTASSNSSSFTSSSSSEERDGSKEKTAPKKRVTFGGSTTSKVKEATQKQLSSAMKKRKVPVIKEESKKPTPKEEAKAKEEKPKRGLVKQIRTRFFASTILNKKVPDALKNNMTDKASVKQTLSYAEKITTVLGKIVDKELKTRKNDKGYNERVGSIKKLTKDYSALVKEVNKKSEFLNEKLGKKLKEQLGSLNTIVKDARIYKVKKEQSVVPSIQIQLLDDDLQDLKTNWKKTLETQRSKEPQTKER